jgi:glycosyltransferase involved in cell wall biosynthesis
LHTPQTGYFNLLAELVRHALSTTDWSVTVVASPAGRVALRERLGDQAARVRFRSAGWRAVHWRDVHEVIAGTSAQSVTVVATIALGVLAARWQSRVAMWLAILAGAGTAVLNLDALFARWAQSNGRPRLLLSERIVRYLWRHCPRPWRKAPAGSVELLVWRGRFRYRDARRVAVVQDLTTRMRPELHTAGTVAEFDEFLRYVQRHAHAIATVSEYSRQDIIRSVDVNPLGVSVMRMPIHPQFVKPALNYGHVTAVGLDGNYLLCVGTIEPRKNLRRLTRAFEKVAERHSAVELVLAGRLGWDSAFTEFLLSSSIASRVRRVGYVPLPFLPSLYHFAKAVVVPSLYEGFGLPVLEAMCSSAVVLASNVTSLPEVLGDAGGYFDPLNVRDMTRSLEWALDLDEASVQQLRERARRRAEFHIGHLRREPLLGIHR